MNDVQLAPHRFAALVASAVDRVFTGATAAGRDRGGTELSQQYGGPSATGFLVEFRTRLAASGGAVSGAGVTAVTGYHDQVECQRVLDEQVAYRPGPERLAIEQETDRAAGPHAVLTPPERLALLADLAA